MVFSMTSSGFEQLEGLSGWRFAAVATEWANRVESRVEAAVKHEAPVGTGPDAGALRDSIRVHIKPGAERVEIECTAAVPYARYVVEGTAPHVIQPRQARALHWLDGGGSHFARRVNHPGTHPDPFPQRALHGLREHLAAQFAAIAALQLRR